MNYELVQWLILGALPAALAIFGVFSPLFIGERWERIEVVELRCISSPKGEQKYEVIYLYDKSKLKHRKYTTKRVYDSLVEGKRYKALIRRTQILMIKHPAEYTI